MPLQLKIIHFLVNLLEKGPAGIMNHSSRLKKISLVKFTTLALSLLSSSSKANLIRLTRLGEKIPQKDSYQEKIKWIRELFQRDHPSLENLLRPCMLVDRPEISREMASWPGVYFTHPGAEAFFNHLSAFVDQYSEEYGTIADRVWEEMSGERKGGRLKMLESPQGDKQDR